MRRIVSLAWVIFLYALLLVSVTSAQTTEDPLAKVESLVLNELAARGETDFFIWMKEKADLRPAYLLKTKEEKGRYVFEALREVTDRTQKGVRSVLDLLGVRHRAFYISNKILVHGAGPALLADLLSRADVGRVTANKVYQLEEPVAEPPVGEVTAIGSNISFIRADEVWAMGINGTGTVLAGNDTGLDETHPAIARHYRGCLNPPACTTWDHNYNWWDATGTYPLNPFDGDDHGTHTTGTMVGDDGGANRIGVAPGAKTIHCKNLDDAGSGSDASITECFEWDLAPWNLAGAFPDPGKAPDAVNNSWGSKGGGWSAFEDEINALQVAGIAIEVSAGNDGPACRTLGSPGDYQQVLTTGSVSHAGGSLPGTLSNFSSRGASGLYPGVFFPDIMAPGQSIRSSTPGNSYASWNGTSMAGPHATALIGLIWSASPALRGEVGMTYQIIRETAFPLTDQFGSNCGGDYTVGPNQDWGHGTIDALAAVLAAISPEPDINVEPGSIDFAGVPTGTFSDVTVLVKNTGGTNLVLGTIGSPSAPFSRAGGDCTNGLTLAYNESCSIVVRFGPTGGGSFLSSFAITSSDGDEPSVSVNLEGLSGPDLRGDWTLMKQDCSESKCRLKGKIDIENVGIDTAPSSTIRFYLSNDGNLDGGDEFLREVSSRKVGAGRIKAKHFRHTLQASATGKYIIAVIDASAGVMESDKENNVAVQIVP